MVAKFCKPLKTRRQTLYPKKSVAFNPAKIIQHNPDSIEYDNARPELYRLNRLLEQYQFDRQEIDQTEAR